MDLFFCHWVTALLFIQGRLSGGTLILNNVGLILVQYKEKNQKLEENKAMCLAATTTTPKIIKTDLIQEEKNIPGKKKSVVTQLYERVIFWLCMAVHYCFFSLITYYCSKCFLPYWSPLFPDVSSLQLLYTWSSRTSYSDLKHMYSSVT